MDKHREKKRAKARKWILPTYWRILLLRRDGDLCHLCGRQVPISGFSPDHVVPISLGGSSNISNVRVSHWPCNYVRRDKIVERQLMLPLDWKALIFPYGSPYMEPKHDEVSDGY